MATQTRQKVTGDPIVKAMAHPLRLRMLRELNRRVASPSEIARDLDQSLPNVAYHMRILLAANCVELVETKQRRGTIEHFYRATTRPMIDDEHWRSVPLSVRRQLVGRALNDIFDHVAAAASDGGFDDEQVHVSWTPFEVDGQGWDDLTALLAEMLERAMVIAAESAARRRDNPGAIERRTELAVLHFERNSSSTY